MSIFKAYDIRGIYPDELDDELAYMIGRAYASYLSARTVAVSRDMRVSGPAVAKALRDGITAAGTDVVDAGMLSTPANYFAIGHYGYDGGIQVTASHNPAEYNGFKVSRENAIPMGYETGLADIERMITEGLPKPAGPRGSISKLDILEDYKKHVLSFAGGVQIAPLKVAIDTANGIMGKMLPSVLEDLPIEVVPLFFEVDGTFPNHEANPLKAENLVDLQAKVTEAGCDFGIAFDGDGDRTVYVDEAGQAVSSDLVTALVAREILAAEPGAKIVYDLRSSWAVPEEIRKAGGTPVRARVGHAFIKQILRDEGAPFAGELSGHFYFRDNFCADSGIISFLMVLRLLSTSGKSLKELVAPVKRYHATGEINFEVADKQAMINELARRFSDGRIDYLDGITVQYADWWFNVRPSNTEPLLRLILEAKTAEMRDEKRNMLEGILGTPV